MDHIANQKDVIIPVLLTAATGWVVFQLLSKSTPTTAKKSSKFPGPMNVKAFFQIPKMKNSAQYAYDIIKQYGPTVETTPWFGLSFYWSADENLLNEVLKHPAEFDVAAEAAGAFGSLLPKCMFAVSGDEWKTHRRLIHPIVSSGKYLGMELPIMIKTARRLASKIKELSAKGEPFDLNPLLFNATLEVFLSFNFGLNAEQFDEEGTKLRNALAVLLKEIKYRLDNYHGVFKQNNPKEVTDAYALVTAFIEKAIAKAKDTKEEDEEHPTLISLLYKASQSENHPLSHQDIVDETVFALEAAHDTTATLLSNIFYFIGQKDNQHLQESIVKEFTDKLEDQIKLNASSPKDSHLTTQFYQKDNLPYINGIIKESLRYFTLLGTIPRGATRDVTVEWKSKDPKDPEPNKVLSLKKGQCLIFSTKHWHYSEEYYKNPQKFNPNRWVEGHEDFDGHMRTSPIAMSAFGQGGRKCIGNIFAALEAKVFLTILLRELEFTLVKPSEEIVMITTRPKHVWMTAKPRPQ